MFRLAIGDHPASYPVGTRGHLSPAVERSQHEADHSSPCSAEVKDVWSYTSTPTYAFMVYDNTTSNLLAAVGIKIGIL